jgi:osmotically-inducible protein OsmY
MTFGKNDRATDTANSGKAKDPYVPDGHGRTDEQIRADVHELLTNQAGQSVSGLSLSVKDGIVTLEGEVQSQAEQQRVSNLLRAVPSVKRVENKLRLAGGGQATH